MVDLKKGKLYSFGDCLISVQLDFVDVVQVSEIYLEAGGEIERHNQFSHEISLILSGNGTFFCDERQYPVMAGNINVMSNGHVHSISCNMNEQMRFLCLGFSFNDKIPVEFLKLKEFYDNIGCHTVDDSYEIRALFDMLLSEMHTEKEYGKYILDGLVKHLLIAVKRRFDSNALNCIPRMGEGQKIGLTIFKILKYVDNNLLSIKNVGEVADALSYSKFYVSHKFKEKTGETLQEYISKRKLDLSLEMLRENRYSVVKVATKLGYETPQNFSKAFKKRFGVNPGEIKTNYNT